jgi:hypothetical protein
MEHQKGQQREKPEKCFGFQIVGGGFFGVSGQFVFNGNWTDLLWLQGMIKNGLCLRFAPVSIF